MWMTAQPARRACGPRFSLAWPHAQRKRSTCWSPGTARHGSSPIPTLPRRALLRGRQRFGTAGEYSKAPLDHHANNTIATGDGGLTWRAVTVELAATQQPLVAVGSWLVSVEPPPIGPPAAPVWPEAGVLPTAGDRRCGPPRARPCLKSWRASYTDASGNG